MNIHPELALSGTPTPATQLQMLYVAYFNRPADPGGLAYWLDVLTHPGVTIGLISSVFAQSPEYTSVFANLSREQVVDTVYLNLFGRHAEPAGQAYWVDLLNRGLLTVSNVVTQVSLGAQGTDATAFAAKVGGASAFTSFLVTPDQVAAYNGAHALAAAKAFIASITDSVTLAAQTTADALQNLVQNLPEPPPVPVAQTFALTTGIDNIAPSNSVMLKGNDIFNGNQDGLSSGDSLDGGLGSDTLNLTSVLVTPLTVPSDITVRNIETTNLISASGLTIDTHGWVGLNNLNATSNGRTVVTLGGTDLALNTVVGTNAVVVNGGNNLNLTVSGAQFGADGLSVGRTTAATGVINVSYNTKDVGGSGLIDVVGGTKVNISQTHSHGVNVTSANVPVNVLGGLLTTEVNVNNAAAATASATVPGVSLNRVTVSDVNGSDFSAVGHIQTVTANNYSSLTINDNALVQLGLSGGAGDVTINNNVFNPNAAKSLSVTLAGVLHGTLGDNGVYTSLAISTNGSDSTLSNINETALTTINLSGSKHLSVASPTGLAAVTNVTVSGGAGLSLNLSGTALTRFDASGTTGANTITFDESKADYLGGSGADIVTVTAIGVNHTIKVGSGADQVTFTTIPGSLNTYTSILDPHAGLTIGVPDKGAETFVNNKVVLGNGATFHDYADAVIVNGGNASINGVFGWFQFGGDTYLVESRHNAAITASFVGGQDFIVRLAGLVDLSPSLFNGTEALTLA